MEFVGAGLPQSATDTVLITFNYSAAMFFLHHALNPPFSFPLTHGLLIFSRSVVLHTKNFEWISIEIILRIQKTCVEIEYNTITSIISNT